MGSFGTGNDQDGKCGGKEKDKGHPLKGLSREKTPPRSKNIYFLIDS